MVKSKKKIEDKVQISSNNRRNDRKGIKFEIDNFFREIYGSSKNSEIKYFSTLEKDQILSKKEEIHKILNKNYSAKNKTRIIKYYLSQIEHTSIINSEKNPQKNTRKNTSVEGKKKNSKKSGTNIVLKNKKLKTNDVAQIIDARTERDRYRRELLYIKILFEKNLGFKLQQQDLDAIREKIGPDSIYYMDKKEVKSLCNDILTNKCGKNNAVNQSITRKNGAEKQRKTNLQKKDKKIQENYNQKQSYWGSNF